MSKAAVLLLSACVSLAYGNIPLDMRELLEHEQYVRWPEHDTRPQRSVEGSADIADDLNPILQLQEEGSGGEEEVVGELPESLSVREEACEAWQHGCCPGTALPAHGPRQEGCCLSSEHGCCQDSVRPAQGPAHLGCDCQDAEFGCCPDGKASARGPEGQGCGCKNSEHGCCQDQYTPATGPDLAGCPCHTYDHGCCADGATVAQGSNGEGCPECEGSECCEDSFTPVSEGGLCDCSGSRFGCCPDGETEAAGENFEGCDERPGESCHLSKDGGGGTNFTVRWFFDGQYGACSRFWFAGDGGNANNFEDLQTCEEVCVAPPGSARCYLPQVTGVCTGSYENWFYDAKFKQCMAFRWGGCLGNNNRFDSRLECEQSCVRSDGLATCEQPLEPGPCRGAYPRWYYDENDGECKNFTYGGCQGNMNRFASLEACENTCRHKIVTVQTAVTCKQPIEEGGGCNPTEARWGFSEELKQCVPFYFTGCQDNTNNFPSLEECEAACPNSFPPEVELAVKVLNVEEGTRAILNVSVQGNPFPDIYWQHNQLEVRWDERVQKFDNHTVLIAEATEEDAGTWTVIADNGLGKIVRKQMSVSIYPGQIPIEVSIPLDNNTFEFGADIELRCEVEGFPVPKTRWFKNNAGLPKSDRIKVINGNTLVVSRASPIDGGAYICRATNEFEEKQAWVDIVVSQGEVPVQCRDEPGLANCQLIVKYNYCTKNENYARICCESCVLAGQIMGPPA